MVYLHYWYCWSEICLRWDSDLSGWDSRLLVCVVDDLGSWGYDDMRCAGSLYDRRKCCPLERNHISLYIACSKVNTLLLMSYKMYILPVIPQLLMRINPLQLLSSHSLTLIRGLHGIQLIIHWTSLAFNVIVVNSRSYFRSTFVSAQGHARSVYTGLCSV